MKKHLYTAFIFILNWFLILSGLLVSSVLWSYFFYNTNKVEITPKRFLVPGIIGFIAALYFLSTNKDSSKKIPKNE